MSKNDKSNLKSAMPVIFGIAALLIVVIASVVVVTNERLDPNPDPTPAPAPSPDPEPVPIPTPNSAFIELPDPIDEKNLPENGALLDDFSQVVAYFDDVEKTDYDFENYNYVFFQYQYDDCSEQNIEPTDYNYDTYRKRLTVTLSYNQACGLCAPQYAYWLLRVPKGSEQYEFKFSYKTLSNEDCDDYPYVVKKPIIYLYPTKTTDVTVKLAHPELITSSYPKYINGWKVTADPSGKLTDKTTGRELYSLYWEGANRNAKMYSDGFIVKGSDVADFLEAKLAKLGLTDREAEEFIIYWLPVLEQNNYNYIRFETMAEINSYMPLEINPNPDTLIRVIMDYKALDAPIEITEQKLETPTRTGFTVVEWGGTQIK